MKIYVVTDLEGATAVTGGWSEISPGCREHEWAKRMLTADINAIATGVLAGGADEILVWDGHGASLSVNVEELRHDIRLIKGRAVGHLPLLDDSFDAMIIAGMHAMEGVPDGVMNGTWAGGMRMWLNGREVGELGLWMAMAAEVGVPTIMVTGDSAVVREARDLVPNIFATTTKIGLSRYCCEIIPPKKVWAQMTATSQKAVEDYRQVGTFQPAAPVEARVQYSGNTQLVDWVALRPGVRRVDGSTVCYSGGTLKDAVGALFHIAWWNLGDKPKL